MSSHLLSGDDHLRENNFGVIYWKYSICWKIQTIWNKLAIFLAPWSHLLSLWYIWILKIFGSWIKKIEIQKCGNIYLSTFFYLGGIISQSNKASQSLYITWRISLTWTSIWHCINHQISMWTSCLNTSNHDKFFSTLGLPEFQNIIMCILSNIGICTLSVNLVLHLIILKMYFVCFWLLLKCVKHQLLQGGTEGKKAAIAFWSNSFKCVLVVIVNILDYIY